MNNLVIVLMSSLISGVIAAIISGIINVINNNKMGLPIKTSSSITYLFQP